MSTDEPRPPCQEDLVLDFEVAYRDLARRAKHGRFEPNADVRLSGDGRTLIATVELAGADPAELRVGLEGPHLIVLGVRNDRERSSRGSVFMKEIEYGHFLKQLPLPVAVDYHAVSASYHDGLLIINLPVAERAHTLADRTEIKITVKRIIN